MNWNETRPRFLITLLLLGMTACHNNAHLRTQKILEHGEKVYSMSAILAVTGDTYNGDINKTGISGFRGEISMLTGNETNEKGLYAGIGMFGAGGLDLIVGYEYKKYTKLDMASPWKLGVQMELNITTGDRFEEGFRGGTVLHLRPSYTSTTAKERPIYAGVHGLFAMGNLKDFIYWEYTIYDYDYSYGNEPVSYQFTSIGAGLTAGLEYFFRTSSLQFQVDVSLVQNAFHSDDYPPDINTDNLDWYSWSDNDPVQKPTIMITGSAGINFFKSLPKPIHPSKPYPLPYYYEEEIYEQEVEPKPELQFDPETGLPLEDEPVPQFDPETGEHIESDKEIKFDPESEELIKVLHDPTMDEFIKKSQYDPETGELIQNQDSARVDKEKHNEAIVLLLKSGDQISGYILIETESDITLEHSTLGVITISKQKIETMNIVSNNVSIPRSAIKIENVPKENSAYEIRRIAIKNANQNHNGLIWGTIGAAGCGTGIIGGTIGGSIADFPGFLIGSIIGLSFPYIVSGNISDSVLILYPSTIKNYDQKQIYQDTYIKKTKELRKKSVFKGQSSCALGVGAFFLLAIIGF